MTETISTKQLAAILGISVQRVNELGRKGKIQRESDGGWNLVKVNAALRQNLDKHQTLRSLGQKPQSEDPAEGELGKNTGESFAEAQRQNEWLKVQKQEMELRLRREELAEIADTEQVWSDIVSTAQTRLLGLPGKLGPRVAACSDVLECVAIIDREIREILSSLVEYRHNEAA